MYLFLTTLEAGKAKVMVQADSVSGEDPLFTGARDHASHVSPCEGTKPIHGLITS